jgi:ABC-type polysaccharide/polyol phosphate transport system ATPase subunit
MTVISFQHVTKTYHLHNGKPILIERLWGHTPTPFIAVNKLTLSIKKGERVGIIGHNGSGKTTVLKLMAKIATPTKGSVVTSGKVISLIDLDAGFHPEMSGVENVYLNGLLLGMNRQDIDAVRDKIIDFADIGSFMYSPLYTYSQGMKLRLGFSVAVHSNPDVMLLDENMAVGDKNFQQKSNDKLRQMLASNKTLVLVSHNLQLVRQYCQRVIILEHGEIISDGPVDKVISAYHQG